MQVGGRGGGTLNIVVNDLVIMIQYRCNHVTEVIVNFHACRPYVEHNSISEAGGLKSQVSS